MSALVVVGFHRSGTSMLSQILHQAGLFIGDELLSANAHNPYGHFEDEEVVGFHDRVLKSFDENWMFGGDASELSLSDQDRRWIRTFVGKRNSDHTLWGFKDPRVCLFLSEWRRVIENGLYVIVFRDFLETTQSILSRQSNDIVRERGNRALHLKFWQTPSLAYRMWNAHNREILKFVAAHGDNVLCLRHRQLLAGYPILGELRRRGIELNYVSERTLIDLEVTKTEVGGLPGLDDPSLEEARDLWKQIKSLTGGSDFDIEEKIERSARIAAETRFDGRPPSVGTIPESLSHDYDRLFEIVASQKPESA